MKKIIAVIVLLIVGTYVGVTQYPKLNLIAGYTAKNMCSNVFLANRSVEAVNSIDHKLPLIKLSTTTVDTLKKTATSSVFGLLKRTAVYRDGLGAVLIGDNYNYKQKLRTPNRNFTESNLEFPYGNQEQKDTVFDYIDYPKLNNAVTNAFAETNSEIVKNTRTLLILHKDKIIAEKYAQGFDKNTRLIGWSMAKNIMATCIGVLEKENKLSIHSKVADVSNYKEWKNDNRYNITVDDVLKMSTGLEWDEDYTKISDVTKMLFLEKDLTLLPARKKLVSPPGEVFNYGSGASNILSGIARSQFNSHQEYLDFPYKTFIDKIGMHSMIFETDMAGNYVASSYAWANTRDWAKFGLLYLHKGNWNGEEIFKESWADYVATPTKASEGEYGAHFWTNQDSKYMSNAPAEIYYADGYHGQRVFIIPSKEIVIVRTGLSHISRQNTYQIMDDLLKDILSAFPEQIPN